MKCFALALAAVLLGGVAGCERQMRGMYQQPRYDPGEGSSLFPDGKAARPPAPGSVPAAAGQLAATSSGRRGREVPAQWQAADAAGSPAPITRALLLHGRERYEIFCMPCHSPVGDGDGPVVRRGFPRPPTYHQQRLREAPDRHFFDVMTHGHGIMYSYADRITPEDRWAIVAYIRALQLSQHVQLSALPPALRESLPASPAVPASGSAGAAR
ncbi:Cytochrome c, mono- and diheme variants [Variovorax sp. PBL-H6]|uniref:c-type cytochrome n=1 Tax=Variovorax sp. PBL-H6 TaxID=434009 RepID=UPI001318F5D1|nr:cytochrome c [Variovorax sp. PBL-H6]VTU21700.1 Cytochrome c, mono- and diheme variants [Variovorax sp. PBL-H6]